MSESADDRELRNAARAAGLTADAEHIRCPVCGKEFDSRTGLRNHERSHQSGREKPAGAGLPSGFKADLDKAVTNTITIGALASNFAPHLGVTIAGVQNPETGEWVVRSRAMVAGEVLLGHAQSSSERAAQIWRLLRAYNRIFEGSAALDVAISVTAAALVDTSMIRAQLAGGDPVEVARNASELAIKLPVVGDVRVVDMAIPDVLKFVRENMLEPAQPEAASGNGHAPRRRRKGAPAPEHVEGGVTET